MLAHRRSRDLILPDFSPSTAPDRLSRFLNRPPGAEAIATAVVHPCDQVALEGVCQAADRGLIAPVLVGPADKIEAAAEAAGCNISAFPLEPTPHSHAAAARGVELVRQGRVALLMKGSLHTDELMHEVVSPETGITTERRVSHVYIMDVPTYPRLLLITDAAVNIAPTLEEKRDIIQNAVDLAQALGLERPKVAILSAVETVTSKLKSTIDAAALCKMADRNQICGADLDGPLAFDNAVSPEAAAEKGLSASPVAGRADIVIVPDLEAGNMLAKQLTFLAGARAAAVVLGAKVPVILTSRADSVETRVASCAVAVMMVERGRPPLKACTS
jgi:phosphotransacetylase